MDIVKPVTMLWFDKTPEQKNIAKSKPFAKKLSEAVDYYRTKYGLVADQCIVSNERFAALVSEYGIGDGDLILDGIAVLGQPGILPWDMHISGDRRAE